MTLIITLAGGDSVGKSHTASKLERLLDTLNLTTTRVAIASSLRNEVSQAKGIPLALMYQKPTPEYIRKAMISYGQYRVETEGERYWINQTIARLKNTELPQFVIIDDMRWQWEQTALSEEFDTLSIFITGNEHTMNRYQIKPHLAQLRRTADITLDKYPSEQSVIQALGVILSRI